MAQNSVNTRRLKCWLWCQETFAPLCTSKQQQFNKEHDEAGLSKTLLLFTCIKTIWNTWNCMRSQNYAERLIFRCGKSMYK